MIEPLGPFSFVMAPEGKRKIEDVATDLPTTAPMADASNDEGDKPKVTPSAASAMPGTGAAPERPKKRRRTGMCFGMGHLARLACQAIRG